MHKVASLAALAGLLIGTGAFAADPSSAGGGASEAPLISTGSNKLEIFALTPPLAVQNYASGFYTPRGFGLNVGSVGGVGYTQFGFGLTGGAAYQVTDLISAGAALGINVGNTSGSAGGFGGSETAWAFRVEPLAKLNLGKTLGLGAAINPFAVTGLSLGGAGAGNFSGFEIGLDLDAGIEYRLTPSWSIMAFIPLDLTVVTSSPSLTNFSFGIEYGVGLYF